MVVDSLEIGWELVRVDLDTHQSPTTQVKPNLERSEPEWS
jgi:hypothetical protein